MTRIAIISTMGGFPWGGSEYLWAATAEEAIAQGHEVFISISDWSISHPIVKKLQYLGACILPRPKFIKQPSLLTRAVNRLAKPVKKHLISNPSPYQAVFDCKPDVMCISQGSSYDVAYIPDLRQLLYSSSIPCTIICQFNSDVSSLGDSEREAVAQILNYAQLVCFVSDHNRKVAERHLACSIPNGVVVKNPINLIDKSLVHFPRSPTISFACVARLETFCKGQDILLESFSSDVWRSRNWCCRLYGSGPDQEYLKSLIQYYKIDDRIQFMGHINDVRSIWAENHILVLPSRGEGTPLSLVEGMLCGRPAVVTDVGGHVEWIEESKTGFIANAPTANYFNTALEKAWLYRDNWEQMGLAAHEYAKDNFDKSPGKTMLKLVINSAIL